ncbi:hypothetical protein [Spirillospora sp. CA-128828]
MTNTELPAGPSLEDSLAPEPAMGGGMLIGYARVSPAGSGWTGRPPR